MVEGKPVLIKQINGAFRVFEGTEASDRTVFPVNVPLKPLFLPVGQHLVSHGLLSWAGYLT